MNNSNEIGAEFEEEVKYFLEHTLNFSDVKGGPNFHIAPEGQKNQIDACARYDNVLFVFECKAAGKQTIKNMRSEIRQARDCARTVIDNYKSIPEYKNCTYVRFIYITKKITLPEENQILFDEKPLWYSDDGIISYYTELNEKIGKSAVYNFLSEFKITPHPNEKIEIKAMKTRVGKFEVFNFYANPSELIKFSYVARRRSQKEGFYQRMLDKHRVKNIQKYISEGGVFPTNIVLSLRGRDISFKQTSVEDGDKVQTGILKISGNYDACWIIDGQHRFYSMALSNSKDLVPCLAFRGISVETERSFFLDINKEQKPIPSDLVWDLEGLANPESYRGIISNAVRTLSKREIFLGKIYIPINGEKIGRQINMAAFCNGINNSKLARREIVNCYGINPLYDELAPVITKQIANVFERFYKEIDLIVDDTHRSFVFGNAGIPVTLYLLEPIISYIGRRPSLADLKPYAESINDYLVANYPDQSDIKNLRLKLNSEGARKIFAQEIGLFIRRELKQKNFWPKLEENELLEEAADMERRIGLLISEELKIITSTWRTTRVPGHISMKATERSQVEGNRFDENLSFGDELQIITAANNWKEVFEKIFTEKGRFQNIEEVKLAFNYISKIRNSKAHGKSEKHITENDVNQFDVYMQKLDIFTPDNIN